MNHFLDWCVYEGALEANPFKSVMFDQKVRPKPYAVPTDEEVRRLLADRSGDLHPVFLTCLLSGMRAGEAAGLLREDLVSKGNLGTFAWVRPNELRLLKTDAAERLDPVHPVLEELFADLPNFGPLFPDLNVNQITKAFAKARRRLKLERPGLVFHSTRRWLITQCERTVTVVCAPRCSAYPVLRDLAHLKVGSAFRNVRYKFVSQIAGRGDLRIWSPALAG
ncbi:hypothetical protein [Leisingera caerulea]|uniref:hypothetical protein n=1 Tax=Leisingera caerulea TaxID=506591 RepID=UPI0021A3A2A5|nr:hypothetical protein [Leisingera caerulea]UWQ82734.1 hypothetical protein K3726_13725 [Leisingera caerulea]